MKREQAEEIVEHLLGAAFDLDEARLALAGSQMTKSPSPSGRSPQSAAP
jgi:hypothetical protein